MKRLKRQAFLLFLCLVAVKVNAQNQEALLNRFYQSIFNNIIAYQTWATLIRIDINNLGKIGELQVSDSADAVFVNNLMRNKQNLDWKALIKYIKLNNLKNISLIIPFYISNPDQSPPVYNKVREFLKFKNKELLGRVLVLETQEVIIRGEDN